MKASPTHLTWLLPLALLTACGPRDAQPAPQTAEQPPSVPAPPSPPPPAAPTTRWRCAELLVSAAFAQERVDLAFSGRKLALPIAKSGSGARYADEKGNEFWNKGEQAVLALAGEEKRDCDITEHLSPWEDARARGVVLRAIGQEPGWWAEIGAGEAYPLHAELDYGERKIDIARSHGISSTPGFGAQMEDGTNVILRTKQEACSDAMSGERFETSAELTVGDKTYKGCGAYLDR